MKKKACIIGFITAFLIGGAEANAQYDVDSNQNGVAVVNSEGKQVVNISSDNDRERLSIEVAGFQIKLKNDKNGNHKESVITRNSPLNRGRVGFLEIGVNSFSDVEYYMYDDDVREDFMKLRKWNSWHIAMTALKVSFDLDRNGSYSFTTGIQVIIDNYAIAQDITLVKRDGMIVPVDISDYSSRKSRLLVGSMRIPFIVELNLYNNFFVSYGVHVGINSNSTTLGFWKNTSNDNMYVNSFYAGFSSRIGWKNIYLYMSSNFTELFKRNMGPMINSTHTYGIGFNF